MISKFDATCVAAGLFFVLPFCPTRLNAADDPTRDVEIRGPFASVGALSFDRSELHQLAKSGGLRRWAANWVRVIVRLRVESNLF